MVAWKNRKETLLTGYLVVISMVLLALRLKITQDSFFFFGMELTTVPDSFGASHIC